jgi:hypothetical protein
MAVESMSRFLTIESLPILTKGRKIEQNIARGVALGDLDPMTKEAFVVGRLVPDGNRTVRLIQHCSFDLGFLTPDMQTNVSWTKPKMKAPEGPENAKSIKSYFSKHRGSLVFIKLVHN